MVSGSAKTASLALGDSKRAIVKIGTAILCDENGEVRSDWLSYLAKDIAELRARGCEVIVVSSGAIAIGKKRLGLSGDLRLDEKQAASAAGQALLAQSWQAAFDKHGIDVAQILLTLDDTENRRRYLNARATMRTLLDLGALPLINENDTIATSEIRYGDNDRLGAHAAQLIEADLLVMLSDIDGLYTADPRQNPNARHIAVVEEITDKIEKAAAGPNVASGVGSGGMTSKIAAAKIAGAAGCASIIAPGTGTSPLAAIGNGGAATLISASATRENARRRWIGGRIKSAGALTVDDGAVNALMGGASLLPAGIVAVEGDFVRGDVVSIRSSTGSVIAQGICAFSNEEVTRIMGRKSDAIAERLGYRRRPAVVEKDDLVLRERGQK